MVMAQLFMPIVMITEMLMQSSGKKIPATVWTEENFGEREALVFVGAVGIAVRTIAPYIRNKAQDPAVVCVDETGRWAIPILSGHLGGANALARKIAGITGGEAVITTATDLNGVFAVDLWAKRQGLSVLQPDRIRAVSAKLLSGEEIMVECAWPVAGNAPEQVREAPDGDVLVSCRNTGTPALQLVPRILSLGIGCRRGTDAETLKTTLNGMRKASSPFVRKRDGPCTFTAPRNCAAWKEAFPRRPLWKAGWAWTTSASAQRSCAPAES